MKGNWCLFYGHIFYTWEIHDEINNWMHFTFWWRCDLLTSPKQLSQASYTFAFRSINLALSISFSFIFYFSISNLLRGFGDNTILNYFSPPYWSFVKWLDWKTKEVSMNDSVWRCDLTEHKRIDLKLTIAHTADNGLWSRQDIQNCYRVRKGLIKLY